MPALDYLLSAPDHFTLLGFEQRFDIDESAVRSRYLELMRLTQPGGAASDADPSAAAELASRLQEARKVLADPEARAEYLLASLGGPRPGDMQDLSGEFREFLVGLVQRRDEAQRSGDVAALAAVRQETLARRATHFDQIAAYFRGLRGGDSPGVRVNRMRGIRSELNALHRLGVIARSISPDGPHVPQS